MKKKKMYIVFCILLLATLACRLPFISYPQENPVVSTEDSVLEESTPLAQTGEPEAPATPEGEARVYSDNGIEIVLPGSYVLGNVENDLAILAENLQAMGEQGQDIQSLYEQNKDDIVLWGYDTKSSDQHMTSLLILKNEEYAGMPLAIISVFAKSLLGDEVELLSQERLTFGDRSVLRLLTTAETTDVDTAQAIYLFNESGILWIVGFFTNQGQIDQRLSTFDAAVASMTIISVE